MCFSRSFPRQASILKFSVSGLYSIRNIVCANVSPILLCVPLNRVGETVGFHGSTRLMKLGDYTNQSLGYTQQDGCRIQHYGRGPNRKLNTSLQQCVYLFQMRTQVTYKTNSYAHSSNVVRFMLTCPIFSFQVKSCCSGAEFVTC